VFESSGFAIGLMSGTSGDGIDAALVKFTERCDSIFPSMELAESHYVPYTEEQRDLVFRLFDPNVSARYVAHMHVQSRPNRPDESVTAYKASHRISQICKTCRLKARLRR
jgi:1,6-anhydro-N-acetylmuramate kinase